MSQRPSKGKPQRPEREAATPDVPDVEPRHREIEDDDAFDREARLRFDDEALHPPGQPPPA